MSIDDSFIREVNEDMQRDRLQRLWSRYGAYLIGLVVLIVLATAAGVGYRAWSERSLKQQGEAFAAADARRGGDPAAAAAAYADVAAAFGGDPAAVARMLEAGSALNANAADAATAALDRAEASSADPILSDAAALMAGMNHLEAGDADAAEAALTPLVAADRPFRHSAKEMLALADLARGDTGRAIERLREVANEPSAPPGLRGRAAELLAALGAPLDPAGGAAS